MEIVFDLAQSLNGWNSLNFQILLDLFAADPSRRFASDAHSLGRMQI